MSSARKPSLDKMFNPSSVAVIGASRDPKKIGNIVLKNIEKSDYSGKVFPVNPKAEEINSLKTYKSVLDLPSTPDLVIISLPSSLVIDVIKECAKKGCKDIVVYSAGFKELGNEGEKVEGELKEIAESNNINLLGPNCLGFINNSVPINATFGPGLNDLGNLNFISQSGAIASAFIDYADKIVLNLDKFITLGNKTVLGENEVLNFLKSSAKDKFSKEGYSTYRPVGMYLESIPKGREFLNTASEVSKTNPVFLLKPGKTEGAKKAMQSHTGSLAGDDFVTEKALEQFNIIRCDTLSELFSLSKYFSWEQAPKGPEVAVVSNAGGPGVITADAVSQSSLTLPDLGDKTKDFLQKHLPRSSSILNPVDVLGDALAERYSAALEAVLANKDIHSVLVILTPQIMTEIEKTAENIKKLSKKYNKPIVCSFIGGHEIIKGENILNKAKIPCFNFPEEAIYVLSTAYKWKKKSESSYSNLPSFNYKSGKEKNNLSSVESLKMFEKHKFKIPSYKVIEDKKDLSKFANENNFPFVLKISSKSLLHKTEHSAVVTDIQNNQNLVESYKELNDIIKKENLNDAKIVIQKQIEKGIELIIGSKMDKGFGPFLFFGLGGVYVDLIEDKNLAILPSSKGEIKDMVKKSKAYELLKGYRGKKGYDLEKLYDFLHNFSKLPFEEKDILEIEINPVIVNKDGIWAVDPKVITF